MNEQETDSGLSGQIVGGYKIGEPLGSGGMGDVYRATTQDGHVVAMKFLRADLASDPGIRQRFTRELKVALSIDHPHVVPVLDTGEHENRPYLCQPLIGESLRGRLESERALPPGATLEIVRQVADGLDELARGGIIHRDVKPANVLLDGSHAFIADFGLVKRMQGTNLTRPGQTIGSLDYIAPEQIQGGEVTPATDVYGLACVTFECLTGRTPFADVGGMQLFWAHLEREPPDPAEIAEIPQELSKAILQGLAKQPGERPPSAGGFARSLDRALAA